MLRRKKFRPLETRILWGMALLLLGVGLVGMLLGIRRGDWRILLGSAGMVGLGAVNVYAARRGRPL
jgi:hypothetical protein